MKIPSIGSAGSSAKQSLIRFPWVMAASLVAGILAVLLVDEPSYSKNLIRLFLAAQLGIPLFLAGALWLEAKASVQGRWPWLQPAAGLIGLALLAFYHQLLPYGLNEGSILRHLQLTAGLHLLVAVLPFSGAAQPERMWRFNLALLLRLVNALFFSTVIFAGLSLALLAIEQLLEVGLPEVVYPRIWFGVVFVFNTWFFLAGVPDRFASEKQEGAVPRLVEVFGRLILAPLVTVYLAILTVYLGKVLVTGQWPSGWIGWLVSGVSVAGFLSLLLVYPGWQAAAERWFRIYSRALFILLMPAVGMLLMAVGKRIGQYGLTEMRYFLGILGIWVGAMALWGLFGRRSWLKVVPATLCLLALATSCGPWGAHTQSRHSQLRRLDTLLEQHGRLAEGVIVSGEREVGADAAREIEGSFRYLFQHHGPLVLGDRVGPELGRLLDNVPFSSGVLISGSVTRAVATVLQFLDVELQPGGRRMQGLYVFQRSTRRGFVTVEGFTHLLEFGISRREGQDRKVRLGAGEIPVWLNGNPQTLELTVGRRSISLDLRDMQERLRRSGEGETVPDSLMAVGARTDSLRVMLQFDRVQWQESEGRVENCQLQGYLLFDYPEAKP